MVADRYITRTWASVKALVVVITRRVAEALAEWAGMHKRIEFYVRNPGYESTPEAMGVRSIDFEDQNAYNMAQQTIGSKMQIGKVHQHPFQLTNERGEILGIVPEYVVSWRVYEVEEDWQDVFTLPPGGAPPPEREA